MSKGKMVGQFTVGQRVQFLTNYQQKEYRNETNDKGKMISVFVRNLDIPHKTFGVIRKLHKSGRNGVAEIVPETPLLHTGSRKVARRLQFVESL